MITLIVVLLPVSASSRVRPPSARFLLFMYVVLVQRTNNLVSFHGSVSLRKLL